MRAIVLFSFAFLAATAAIFSSASNAATFAECKRAAVISNWPQLIEELGKDEFDAVIRSCAATPKASPKAGIPYRDAEITSISGLPTGGQKVSHRTGRLLKFDVRAKGTPVDIKNRECVFHEGGEEAKYAYIHTFRNVCDTHARSIGPLEKDAERRTGSISQTYRSRGSRDCSL